MNDKEFFKILTTRQSIRKFTGAKVSDETINEIIEASLKAPSAGNRQPWRIVVVRDKKRKEDLVAAALGQKFIATSQVILGVFAVPEESAERYAERGRDLYCIQDTAALTYAILLLAHSKGLGTCWIGAFDDKLVAKVFKAPKGYRPVAMIPIGGYEKAPPERPRRPASEVVLKETF